MIYTAFRVSLEDRHFSMFFNDTEPASGLLILGVSLCGSVMVSTMVIPVTFPLPSCCVVTVFVYVIGTHPTSSATEAIINE